MKKIIALVLMPVYTFISCQQIKNSTKPVVYTEKQLQQQLHAGLTSPDSLKAFFENWHAVIQPVDETIFKDSAETKTVYNLYKAFYQPRNLLALGNWEWGNTLNKQAKYCVIQNKINFEVMQSDSLDKIELKRVEKEITDFRPKLTIDSMQVLYLTKTYSDALNSFLGFTASEVGEKNIMDPALPQGETEKRYHFLHQYIPILIGHWGNYWHLATFPYITLIRFNKSFDMAEVSFVVGYEGGSATMRLINNKWTITKSGATWIE